MIILIPYFLLSTGVIYSLTGNSNSLLFTSGGAESDLAEINDPESLSINWMGKYGVYQITNPVYVTDTDSENKILSQSDGKIQISEIDTSSLVNNNYKLENGYIFLSSYNVIDKKFIVQSGMYDFSRSNFRFNNQDEICDSGCSEVWWLKQPSNPYKS